MKAEIIIKYFLNHIKRILIFIYIHSIYLKLSYSLNILNKMYTNSTPTIPTTEDLKNKNSNSSNSSNSNNEIDISSILKDVENCIKSGLDDKLQTFFYEFEIYKNTHNEVLNLTLVKNLVNHNNILTRVLNKSLSKENINDKHEVENYSRDINHKMEDNSIQTELATLRQENRDLREKLIKYISIVTHYDYAHVAKQLTLIIKLLNQMIVCPADGRF